MKGILKRAFSLVRGGWKTLFLFEILFRLFAAFIVFPACQWLFNSCLRWTGLNYLTAENLGRFLTDPLMLACSAAILVAFALTTTIEVTGQMCIRDRIWAASPSANCSPAVCSARC